MTPVLAHFFLGYRAVWKKYWRARLDNLRISNNSMFLIILPLKQNTSESKIPSVVSSSLLLRVWRCQESCQKHNYTAPCTLTRFDNTLGQQSVGFLLEKCFFWLVDVVRRYGFELAVCSTDLMQHRLRKCSPFLKNVTMLHKWLVNGSLLPRTQRSTLVVSETCGGDLGERSIFSRCIYFFNGQGCCGLPVGDLS